MKVIYIDSLIFINILIDYVLLYLTHKLLRIQCKKYRIVLGSTFGGISTLGVFIPFFSSLFFAFYTLVTALIISLISFGAANFKRLLIRTASYIFLNLLLCGIVIILRNLFKFQGVDIYNDVIYLDISPTFLIISSLCAYIAISVYDRIKGSSTLEKATHEIYIQNDNGNTARFVSSVDTGCSLREPFSGLPVILVEKNILPNFTVSKEKLRLIPYSTTAGSSTVFGFKPKKIIIDKKELPAGCYIAVCENKLSGEIGSIMGKELSQSI